VLKALQKIDEKNKNPLANFGGKNKQLYTEVTEKTFFAIV